MEWIMEENFSMEWNMEENFSMEWNGRFLEWNGNGMEENCQFGIWKNRLPFHSIPCPVVRSAKFLFANCTAPLNSVRIPHCKKFVSKLHHTANTTASQNIMVNDIV